MRKAVCLIMAVMLAGGLYFYYHTYFSYEALKELHHFPVPKHADLVDKGDGIYGFNWPKAREEDGIPFGYQFMLERQGWKEILQEGALTEYEKGDFHISVICTNKYLKILIDT